LISSDNILNARILVVDDQEANVLLLEQMLRGAGYVSIGLRLIQKRSVNFTARTHTT
jgi:adenylate cyclase